MNPVMDCQPLQHECIILLEPWSEKVYSVVSSRLLFPFRAGLYQPNLIHFDEFCPDNDERAMEDFHIVFKINPYQLKVRDEKSLKGREVYNWKVQRNPLTGEIPPLQTNSDCTNTYLLIGFVKLIKGQVQYFAIFMKRYMIPLSFQCLLNLPVL